MRRPGTNPSIADVVGGRENAGMVERRSWIPMEDGVRLAVSLFLPEVVEAGGVAPVVLEALPYRKDDVTASHRPEYERLCGSTGMRWPGSICGDGVVGGGGDRRVPGG
jgi:hypothetical protein